MRRAGPQRRAATAPARAARASQRARGSALGRPTRVWRAGAVAVPSACHGRRSRQAGVPRSAGHRRAAPSTTSATATAPAPACSAPRRRALRSADRELAHAFGQRQRLVHAALPRGVALRTTLVDRDEAGVVWSAGCSCRPSAVIAFRCVLAALQRLFVGQLRDALARPQVAQRLARRRSGAGDVEHVLWCRSAAWPSTISLAPLRLAAPLAAHHHRAAGRARRAARAARRRTRRSPSKRAFTLRQHRRVDHAAQALGLLGGAARAW